MGIPYELDIPAASHNPSNDQPLMEQNNNAVNQIIGVDHFSFNTTLNPNTSSGFHQWSTYVDGSKPGAPAGTLRVYSKADINSISQLYFQRDGAATTAADIQLTGITPIIGVAATVLTGVTCNSSLTFLPGGPFTFPSAGEGTFIMMMGTMTGGSGSAGFISFASLGLPNFPKQVIYANTYAWSTVATVTRNIYNVGTTGFTLNAIPGSAVTFTWQVIGY